eukprot:s2366_g10.t1
MRQTPREVPLEVLSAKTYKIGWTALHYAAHNGHAECCRLLMSAAGQAPEFIGAVTNTGRTALHLASVNGHRKCLNVLLRTHMAKKLMTTQSMDGHTAMHLAARFGQENCLKTLAKKLPDLVKVKNLSGHPSLHEAARRGNNKCVETLMALGGGNELSKSTKYYAETRGHSDIADALIEMEQRFKRQQTALLRRRSTRSMSFSQPKNCRPPWTSATPDASPASASEGCAEELSMLAEHLQQALDVTPCQPVTEMRSHQSTAVHPASEGYESTLTETLPGDLRGRPNLRSAMLSLNGEMAELHQAQEGPRGWMRSALLPRCDDPGPQICQDETVSLPASRQPGLREAASRNLLNDNASPADHNAGDLREGWKQLMPPADDFARTAMRPGSPLPVLEQLAPRRMPVLLHIYDVTQEPAIRRLNKVLAHKRMPLKLIATPRQHFRMTDGWWKDWQHVG